MSVSAVKGILWTAIAIAVAMAMASLAFDRNESLALFFGGCALFVVALLWYRRAIPAAEAREEDRQAQQLLTLKQQLSLTGEPVVVKGKSGVSVLVFCGLLSVFGGYHAFMAPTAELIVMSSGLALATAMIALVVGPRVGHPPLTIRPDGLAIPVYGFLRWDEIESIGLQRFRTKGATTYSIDLYVPELKERESRLHPFLRMSRYLLGRRSPNFIGIPLIYPSLPATLVHALCYDLWKERTGKSRAWTSAVSEQEIAQWRRMDERVEMLKRAGAEAATDPSKALQLLDDIEKQFGRPQVKQRADKPLSPEAVARNDALFAQLRSAKDPAETRRLIEKHVDSHVRDSGTTMAIIVVVLAALVVGALTLLGG